MPSQRLLKMLDPRGHLSTTSAPPAAELRAVLASATKKALLWTPRPDVAAWAAAELRAAGIEPLRALSIRHIGASLMPGARPNVSLVIAELDALGSAEQSALTSARWGGYRGGVIAVARGPVPDKLKTMLGIDAVIAPETVDGLRALAIRWVG
jgi:hypothetical protein